jgi:hypothetical protein
MAPQSSYRGFIVSTTVALLLTVGVSPARAVPRPSEDTFYEYRGRTPLSVIAPGTVLDTRILPYQILGLPVALKVTQLLYRSTSQLGQPTVNVTSVVQPLIQLDKRNVVSYQSAYDSLSTDDQPSHVIAGGLSLGGILPTVETLVFAPFLIAGYTIIIADIEGQQAQFAVGPLYGFNTLDSIRAAFNSSEVDLPDSARVALVGYSGGAIGTGWASELASSYAPDVNRRLIGAAMGGVLVSPARNLDYVEGTETWAGVIPMALMGAARAFEIDFEPYLSDFGREVFRDMENASIISTLGRYPGLTWNQLARPEYPRPEHIPAYVDAVNELILGTGGTPTIPMLIGQGTGGEAEGTPGDRPNIGPGDGVMIAGDVRTLARGYCESGVHVQYNEYDGQSHVAGLLRWLPEMLSWVGERFQRRSPPDNCSRIAPGNRIERVALQD